MKKKSELSLASLPVAWLVPAAAAVVIVSAVISYGRSGESHAAPGSPYYGKAVKEAMAGLTNLGENALPAARPPLAAGLSPDEYYWCENCRTYHKREPGQSPPAGAAQAPAAGVAQPPGAVPAQPADVIPPLPEGMSASDHYWCVNCKAYHPRQPAPNNPVPGAGVAPNNPVVPVPTPER